MLSSLSLFLLLCGLLFSQAQESQIFKPLTTSKFLPLHSMQWHGTVISKNVLKITFSGLWPSLNQTLKSLLLCVNFEGNTTQSYKHKCTIYRCDCCFVNQNQSLRHCGTADTEHIRIQTSTKNCMYNSAPWIAHTLIILTNAPEATWKATNHNKHHVGYQTT